MLSIVITLITLCSVGVVLCFMGKKSIYPLVCIGCFIGGIYLCYSLFKMLIAALIGGLMVGIGSIVLMKFIYKVLLSSMGRGLQYIIVFFIVGTSLVGASLLGTIVIFLYQNINDLSNYIYVDGFISTASHLTKYLICTYSIDNYVAHVIVKFVFFIIGVMTQLRNEKSHD